MPNPRPTAARAATTQRGRNARREWVRASLTPLRKATTLAPSSLKAKREKMSEKRTMVKMEFSGGTGWAEKRRRADALQNASSRNVRSAAKKKRSGPGDPLLRDFCEMGIPRTSVLERRSGGCRAGTKATANQHVEQIHVLVGAEATCAGGTLTGRFCLGSIG